MIITAALLLCLIPAGVFAVKSAPRITDREIVERLSRLEEGQRALEARLNGLENSLNERITSVETSLNKRIDDVNKRIDDVNKRIDDLDLKINKRIDDLDVKLNKRIDDLRADMNARFDTLQWMFGLFVTISLVILGFVLRMQWQMHRRLTRLETIQEKQSQDLEFLKSLVEKLLPPKGVL